MIIQLTDADLKQMPSSLSTDLLQWFQLRQAETYQDNSSSLATEAMSQQLDFKIDLPIENLEKEQQQREMDSKGSRFAYSNQLQRDTACDSREASHVRISQLFDMGLLSEKTQIRIRLKQDSARLAGYRYVTNIQISSKGTVSYQGEAFDKPSPLVAKVNGSSANGWEYIEIKRNGEWVCLDELRKIWRKAS